MLFRSSRRNESTPPQTAEAAPAMPDDPTVFTPIKRLGIFAVQYVTPASTVDGRKSGPRVTPMYTRAGAIDRQDTNILELHLRRDISLSDVGPQAVRRSLGLVATYARLHADVMQPDEVVGITDPVLGRVAGRFGFDVHDIDASSMPMVVVAGIDKSGGRVNTDPKTEGLDFRPGSQLSWKTISRQDADFGHLVVAHQTMPEFMQRFGDAAASQPSDMYDREAA